MKRVADDTDWSDFADLIREEKVHLANEAITRQSIKLMKNPWKLDVWWCN